MFFVLYVVFVCKVLRIRVKCALDIDGVFLLILLDVLPSSILYKLASSAFFFLFYLIFVLMLWLNRISILGYVVGVRTQGTSRESFFVCFFVFSWGCFFMI